MAHFGTSATNSGSRMAPDPVSLRTAFWYWLRLGCISFGGPAGQIAIMHADMVERRRWMSEARFLHALNFCMLLPGPEAQQLATYIGWLMHRTWGGLMAGVLFVLPSMLLLIFLAWVYVAWGHVPLIASIFKGIEPVVLALIAHAAVRMAKRIFQRLWLVGIAVSSFVGVALLHMPFPVILLVAAVTGYSVYRWGEPHLRLPVRSPHQLGHPNGAASGSATVQVAWLDDDTPLPLHAQFCWKRLWLVLLVCVGLWLLSMGCLIALGGWASSLTQMAWFFTKAAWLTFGGAYAVLPYVVQGAVEHFQWLTADQMMAGLALGESTPGPLIMVVTFVGFLGGWNHVSLDLAGTVLGVSAFWSGVAAACVATFFTFLPSFLLIFACGPWVESSRGHWQLAGPLNAITAAVVGVIAYLSLFFGYHVVLPQGIHGGVQWLAVISSVLALVGLWRYRLSPLGVIAAGAVFGALVGY